MSDPSSVPFACDSNLVAPTPESFADTPVLVWQMGKVGSTSIGEALKKQGLDPIQLHVLDPDRIGRIVHEHDQRGFAVPRHIEDARRLQKLITDSDQKFRIISLVRDPFARNLSALFESWDVYPPAYNSVTGPTGLAEWFVMNFDYSVLDWFDNEIRARTGLDVYSQSFDQQNKQLVIESETVRMLVLRQEDSQADKERNLRQFLGLAEVKIGYKNTSEDKLSAELWRTMKRSAKGSSMLLDLVYNSRLVKHFYTAEEARAFRRLWTPSQDGIYFEAPE